MPYSTIASSSRTLSPCAKTPTSPPKQMLTPAASAALKAARFWTRPGVGAALSLYPSIEIRGVGLRRRDRGAQRHALPLHKLEHLRGSPVAVLDRFDAGECGAPHPFGGRGVRGDRSAASVCRRDQGLELLEREGRTGLAVRPPAIVGVHLDPVGAMADLAPRDAGDLLDSGRLLRALRRVERVPRR